MRMEIIKLRRSLEREKGKRDRILSDIKKTEKELVKKNRELRINEKARDIFREVGLITQQQIRYHISEIVTLALSSVLNDPYELGIDFVERSGKTECDLFFEQGDVRLNPLDASGGGAVDIASFALRVAVWSMKNPRTQNILILDEPFKMLSSDLMPKAGEMLSQISQELGLQILMITHEEALIESSDRVFRVTKGSKSKVSKVRIEK